MYHLLRPIALVGLSAVCLTGCVNGEGASFATRIDSGSSFNAAAEAEGSTEVASNADSGFMATSGNAILPGGISNPLAGLGGGAGSGSGLFGQDGGLGGGLAGAGNGVTALVGLTANVELSGPNGPGLTVTPAAGIVAGATQTPLAPVVTAANTLTGALLGGVTSATPALSLGGGQTPSVAGQPVTLLAGTTPVLGAAAPVTNAVANTVAPVTSTLVSSVASATAPAPAAGSSAPSGLGGLTALIPPLRLR